MRELVIMGWDLHPSQRAVYQRIVEGDDFGHTLDIGRQWGKTVLLTELCLWALCQPGLEVAYISAFWSQTKIPFNHLKRALGRSPMFKMNESSGNRYILSHLSGSRITFYSAERPDSIRGNTCDMVICDEAGLMKEVEASIMPLLAVKRGKLILAGTPKGRSNWFAKCFEKGVVRDGVPHTPGWVSFRFPSSDSPFVNPQFLADMREQLPEDLYEQEINAAFLDGMGGVFGSTGPAFNMEAYGDASGRLFAGVDVADSIDFTVLTVLNEAGELVFMDRWQRCGYDETVKRLAAGLNQFRDVVCVVETNGPGSEVLFALSQLTTHPLQGVEATNALKGEGVRYVRTRFQRGTLRFPRTFACGDALRSELTEFSYELLPSGNVRYCATPGAHDDCVMSLVWACLILKRYMNE